MKTKKKVITLKLSQISLISFQKKVFCEGFFFRNPDLGCGPPVKQNNFSGLYLRVNKINNCETTFKSCKKSWELDRQEVILSLFKLLPNKPKMSVFLNRLYENAASLRDLKLIESFGCGSKMQTMFKSLSSKALGAGYKQQQICIPKLITS